MRSAHKLALPIVPWQSQETRIPRNICPPGPLRGNETARALWAYIADPGKGGALEGPKGDFLKAESYELPSGPKTKTES